MAFFRSLLVLLALCAPANAQSDWRAWVDDHIAQPMSGGAASAATVSVVEGDTPILIEIYGIADRAGTLAKDANKRFLIASVTKVFTASLVAQAITRGDIESVDDPVNRYLSRAQLPDNCGVSITIRHLLTHTAGFEEKGFGVTGGQDTIPIAGQAMVEQLPAYARCPGEGLVYANVDPPLLGAMLEDVYGQDLRSLMAEKLLEPLGMNDTELVYDPSGGSRMLDVFVMEDGVPTRQLGRAINKPFYAPTGSIQTTAADMAKFMAAQLGQKTGVLSAEALDLLHAPLASNGPGLMQLGGAFFIGDWNGEKYVSHLGAFSGFSSVLVLAIQENTGVFIAWGGASESPLPFSLEEEALKHIYGPFKDAKRVAEDAATDDPSGTYWIERRGHMNAEKVLALDALKTVKRTGPNQLQINGDGPFFAAEDGFYFKPSENGLPGLRYVFDGETARQNADYSVKVSGLAQPQMVRTLGLYSLAAMLSGFLGIMWPKKSGRSLAVGCTTVALSFGAVLYGIGGVEGFVDDLLAGKRWRFTLLSILSFASILLAILLAIGIWDLWRGRFAAAPGWRQWFGKVHSIALALGCVGVSYFAWFTNLY